MGGLRSEDQSKKVIVIGGSGETGRRILYYLRQTYPDLSLASAGRGQRDGLENSINTVRLDLDDETKTIDTLSRYDLAVIAVGPMNAFGERPHRLCLEAGIDCVDINDSLSAADAVFALHDSAVEKGRAVYTGFGLAPGISTLMLMVLARQKRSAEGEYSSRLYMGAAYGGGKSSPYSMLANFNREMSLFSRGQRLKITTPWKDDKRRFHFPGHAKPLDMIPYSTPEIAALAHQRFPHEDVLVNTLDTRFHIQFFSLGLAKIIAAINPGRKTVDFLADKFYRSGQSIKQRKTADPDTYLWVYPDDKPQSGILLHGGVSSYDLTALMACAMIDCWLAGAVEEKNGVFSVEMLSQASCDSLVAALNARGIAWREADVDKLAAENAYFGWLERPVQNLESLRHFGLNWYTVERQHPRMVGLQKQYLLQSSLWKKLKAELGFVQLMRFVVGVMLRWRQHYKVLESYRGKDNAWNTITRDLSMFTSGYSCLRDRLGQDEAFRLYRAMFLETGDMEMRWLWPAPQAFCLLEQPADAARQYWLAFMQGYTTLGLLNFSGEEVEANRYCYRIDRCRYAEIFTKMSCSELSGLVREMECHAFKTMAADSGLNIDWRNGENGSADIILSLPQPV